MLGVSIQLDTTNEKLCNFCATVFVSNIFILNNFLMPSDLLGRTSLFFNFSTRIPFPIIFPKQIDDNSSILFLTRLLQNSTVFLLFIFYAFIIFSALVFLEEILRIFLLRYEWLLTLLLLCHLLHQFFLRGVNFCFFIWNWMLIVFVTIVSIHADQIFLVAIVLVW